MPRAEDYAEPVAAAKAATPPKNGESSVIGIANLARNAPFFFLAENRMVANGEAAGVEARVTDTIDCQAAMSTAESYVRRSGDNVIEFQTDANCGPVIMNPP